MYKRKYQCDYCNREFTTRAGREGHERFIHTKKNNYLSPNQNKRKKYNKDFSDQDENETLSDQDENETLSDQDENETLSDQDEDENLSDQNEEKRVPDTEDLLALDEEYLLALDERMLEQDERVPDQHEDLLDYEKGLVKSDSENSEEMRQMRSPDIDLDSNTNEVSSINNSVTLNYYY
jgi:hypothetical protein